MASAMRIFVTGGTGLVGSHAIERFTALGHDVVALARTERGRHFVRELGATPAAGCVELADDWQSAAGADVILHAAAIVTDPTGWDRYQRINVQGTLHAVRAAAESGSRLLHVSSVAVYGRRLEAGATARVAEDTRFGPIAEADYYARSKREAEAALWSEAERRGVPVLLTTDHGSIHCHTPATVYAKRDATANLRYKFGEDLRAEDQATSIAVDDLPAWGLPKMRLGVKLLMATGDRFFVYPTKLREYQARYRGSFLHGGVTPEEMILPVALLTPRGA